MYGKDFKGRINGAYRISTWESEKEFKVILKLLNNPKRGISWLCRDITNSGSDIMNSYSTNVIMKWKYSVANWKSHTGVEKRNRRLSAMKICGKFYHLIAGEDHY